LHGGSGSLLLLLGVDWVFRNQTVYRLKKPRAQPSKRMARAGQRSEEQKKKQKK